MANESGRNSEKIHKINNYGMSTPQMNFDLDWEWKESAEVPLMEKFIKCWER